MDAPPPDDEQPVARSPIAEADPERQRELGYKYCLRRLTGAPCTEHELRTGLLRKGYPDEVVDDVLHQLRQGKLVDDRLYASLWVDSRARTRALTAPVLRAELRRKGVADELIDEALDGIDPGEERHRAVELVRRKLRGPVPSDRAERDKVVRRLGGMLTRKGYSPGTAWSVVNGVLEGADPEPPC